MFGEISDAVGADVWMLNWDSYTYQRSRAAGSMTLPQGNTATVSSGNISISASSTSSENVVKVNIVRKPDTNPPPTPLLTSNATWIYPGAEILSAGYDDGESAIASFEVKLDEKEISLAASNVEKWTPTYLNPFSAPKTLRVRDLPEGVYALSLRAVDLWGNKSAWSPNVTVSIDRSDPIVTGELTINGIKNGLFETSWKGLSDAGSGLCLTQISNGNDWVTYQSKAKSSPPLTLPATGKLGGTLTVFDCLGNGKSGELSIATAYVGASKARRTGKWTQANDVGEGALRCTGKCSATFTNSGNVGVLVGSGTAQVVIASQKVVDIPNSASNALRIGASINIGKKNQLIRVSGSNFTLVGLAKVDVAIDKIIELDRKPPVDDPSLRESIQLELSKFGFNQSDFTSDWTVLPMARGTTLLDPTLDLCSANYPSESGRVARRQVQVTSSKSKFAFLSTEVVRYRGTKEAEQALSELKARFTECAKNKGGVESSGSFMPYLIVDFPNEVAKKFNSENSLLVRTQIGDNNSPRQLLAFYQYSGENYTGMYLVKNGTIGFTDSEISQWADVANSLRSRMEKTPS
jgi:hypothetical protein